MGGVGEGRATNHEPRTTNLAVLTIAGPTGVGKSEVALAVARRTDGEVIGADSRQVYRGMEVGTAAPTAEARAGVPHHFVAFLDPAEPYSAGRYAREAREVIREVVERGRVPILCGGTGLYLAAVLDGLHPDPVEGMGIRSAVRRTLEAQAARSGVERLYQDLRRVDPARATGIDPQDLQRILRALEVYYLTGRPMSRWQEETVPPRSLPGPRFWLSRPRRELYERINHRATDLLDRLLEEAHALRARGIEPAHHSFEATGYREAYACLDGALSREELLQRVQGKTRQYAKRQITWFRNQPDFEELHCEESPVKEIVERWKAYQARVRLEME